MKLNMIMLVTIATGMSSAHADLYEVVNNSLNAEWSCILKCNVICNQGFWIGTHTKSKTISVGAENPADAIGLLSTQCAEFGKSLEKNKTCHSAEAQTVSPRVELTRNAMVYDMSPSIQDCIKN